MSSPTQNPQDFQQSPLLQSPSQDEKSQSMLCWLLTIVLGFWPGLIFYLISNDKPYLKRQAALSLTLSIVGMVGIFISAILTIILIGLLFLPVVAIWVLVVCIQGAIATNKGENFNPAFIDKLCMSLFKV